MAAPSSGQAREKDPNLPALCRLGDLIAPWAPQKLSTAGLPETELTDLVTKLAYTVPRFTTDWVGKQLHFSAALADEVLAKVCSDGLVEQLWQTSQTSSHYKISDQG